MLLKHLIYSIIGRVRPLSEWSFVLGIEHLSYVSLGGGNWTVGADHSTQPTTPVRYVKRSTVRRKPDLLLQVAVGMC